MKTVIFVVISVVSIFTQCYGRDVTTRYREVSAIVIDGICVNNRAARSPTGYYCSEGGKEQLRSYFKENGCMETIYRLSPVEVDALMDIVLSENNKAAQGKLNFYVRFYNDKHEVGSKALSREILKKLIEKLPKSAKDPGLIGMFERG